MDLHSFVNDNCNIIHMRPTRCKPLALCWVHYHIIMVRHHTEVGKLNLVKKTKMWFFSWPKNQQNWSLLWLAQKGLKSVAIIPMQLLLHELWEDTDIYELKLPHNIWQFFQFLHFVMVWGEFERKPVELTWQCSTLRMWWCPSSRLGGQSHGVAVEQLIDTKQNRVQLLICRQFLLADSKVEWKGEIIYFWFNLLGIVAI